MARTKTRIGRVASLTNLEHAEHAAKAYKFAVLKKKPVTAGIEKECYFCPVDFKPGDSVRHSKNGEHFLHVACIKREIAKGKAEASGNNVLDTVLENTCPDTTPVVVARQKQTAVGRDRQPERLDIKVGAICITISFVE